MGIKNVFLFLLLSLFSIGLFAQDAYIRHTVLAGETAYSIAKSYSISEADLVKYNPDIAGGLKEGTILIIPKKGREKLKKAQTANDDFVYHTVQAKETLYGLSKKYNCTEAQILALNPEITDGLKVGSTIKIPKAKSGQEPVQSADSNAYYYHVVEPKETVYSICKMAGITEQEFLNLNPQVRESGLQIGQTIRLPKSAAVENMPTDKPKSAEHDLYKVLAGDDLAKIAAKFNTTTEELLRLNPELASGLVVGRYILVPHKSPKSTGAVLPATFEDFFWFTPKLGENPKLHFAVVLPLYMANNDSIDLVNNGQGAKIFEKSSTAIQFLAGFLTAMDTLKGMGYQIELDIYDSQNDPETIRSIARRIDKNVDAVIGPLFAKNAELMASLLKDIPIISPLSKTLENADKPNLINCVANQESEYWAMTNLIREQPKSTFVFVNGNKKANHDVVKLIKSGLPAEDTLRVKTVYTSGGFSFANHVTPYRVKGKNTVLLVVDQSPAFISDMFTRLKDFRDSTVIIVTTSKVFDIGTLENSYLNNQSFVGLSTEFVNYTDTATQLFIQKYRVKTATEPNKYAYSGYDLGIYFSQLFAAYGSLPPVQNWPVVKGTFKGFRFAAAQASGAENNYVYRLRIRNFELLETRQ